MNDMHLARGYRYAGIVSGLRTEPNRRDLALIVSDTPAAATGVFTQNRVSAAPVKISKARLPRADARAIVVCSGNANACTGAQGDQDAERMAALTAAGIGCTPEQVLVASTGVIGRPLPMSIMEAGIPKAVAAVKSGSDAFEDAALAILTTDTRVKVASTRVGGHSISGFAKGAAMIGPNMATMLGFVLTDAAVSDRALVPILRIAAEKSFNCISVEGHTSTNDSVFLLANGTGGKLSLGAELDAFREAVIDVCEDLAKQIADDAEGANHRITIKVDGCRTAADAKQIAKTIAESALVKTAVYGADPNWGRVVSAAGYAGVPFEEKDLTLTMGDIVLYKQGKPLSFDAKAASHYLRSLRDVTFTLTFTLGNGSCTFYTCDLTPEYVKLNADYTT